MSLFSDGLLQLDPWIDETEDIVIEEEQPKSKASPELGRSSGQQAPG